MIDIITDTLLDGIKLLPFLFLTFLFMEYLEHKMSDKNKNIIENSGKFGPLIGSILGIIPQCGFSLSATNLFSMRIISTGTLISIYLATSDEMLPILISSNADIKFILFVLFIKFIIGMTFGFLIDFFYRKKEEIKLHEICIEEKCDCENGIIKSSIKHTIHIFIFILIITLILNCMLDIIGESNIESLFLKNKMLSSFLSGLIGLIPNCASSIVITEMYLKNIISFGSMISGLLTNSGIALVVLFKTNKNIKENLKIISILYIIGTICGILIDFIVV